MAAPATQTGFFETCQTEAPAETLAATQWLGRAFNNISSNGPAETFNVGALLPQLKPDNPVFLLKPKTNNKVLTNLSRTFAVPENIEVHTETAVGNGALAIYQSGEEVNTAFETDVSFSANYLGVSVSGSSSYSYKTEYKHDQMYAFTSSSINAYAAELRDMPGSLNPVVRKHALALPPFSEAANVVKAYYEFFRSFGTHVITMAYSGWRIQVRAQASNTSKGVQESFSVYVSVKYLGNSVDAGVKSDSDYKTFNNTSTSESQVYGGKPSDIEALTNLPFPPEARKRWDDAIGTRPDEDIIQVKAEEIGTLFQLFADDPQIQAVGDNLLKALAFISLRRTTIKLQKHTDIATLHIPTDGVIMELGENSNPTVTYNPEAHTITYGKATSSLPANPSANPAPVIPDTFTNDYATRSFVEFSILNNGMPISVVLDYGLLSDKDDKGNNGSARFIVFDGSSSDGKLYAPNLHPASGVPAPPPATFDAINVSSRVDWWNA
jgi:hypothetical protein